MSTINAKNEDVIIDEATQIITHILKNSYKVSFDDIVVEYERISKSTVTPAKKMFLRQKLKKNEDFVAEETEDGVLWSIKNSKTVIEKRIPEEPIEIKKENIKVSARSPEAKLFKRIKRELKVRTYIGDIIISDDEYEILKSYLSLYIKEISNKPNNIANPVIAVALVQIGIRFYDGAFWKHVIRETNQPIDPQKQGKIGRIFYCTLVAYDKRHVAENEMVNNILMHCFITKHYAEDLFDFLFAYYQYDLDRDLERHDKEMRQYLINSMKKGDNSSRAYKIKKHTSDAVMLNEQGCKIRVRNILKWIDAYLFDNVLPEDSPNRVAGLFVEWAKQSKRFNTAKNNMLGLGARGQKRFHSPYIQLDTQKYRFNIILPTQIIPLDDNQELPILSWKITSDSSEREFDVEVVETVIGCKTADAEKYELQPNDIFSSYRIDLLCNGHIIRTFQINRDSIRFFDEDYDMIIYKDYIRAGNIYAFTALDSKFDCEKIIDKEKILGLNLYNLVLDDGDVIKLPSERPLSVGKVLSEGLILNYNVKNAFVSEGDTEYSVFSKAPLIYLTMPFDSEKGTLITINGEKRRFDRDNATVFTDEANRKTLECLINLETFCAKDGIYNITVDIPSERKIRSYDFAVINELKFDYNGAPYVFKEYGSVTIEAAEKLTAISSSLESKDGFTYNFKLDSEEDYLEFEISFMRLFVEIPVFKWKYYEEDYWDIAKPEEMWYREMPEYFYFKFPCDQIRLFGPKVNMDSEDDCGINISKNKESGCFCCDTRKISSWWIENAIYRLSIGLSNETFDFLTIVTKCILSRFSMENDPFKGMLIIKSDIIGYNDCAVDILCNGKILAEKQTLSWDGLKYKTNTLSGDFEVVFWEYDNECDDEFDFGGLSYSEFASRKCHLNNEFDFSKITLELISLSEKKKLNSWFAPEKYKISGPVFINNLKLKDDNNDIILSGNILSDNKELSGQEVALVILDGKQFSKAYIKFAENNQGVYSDFTFDKQNKIITKQSYHDARKIRYIKCSEEYYFDVRRITIDKTNIAVDKLGFSVRTYNSLCRAKIFTTHDIVSYGLENLIKVRNLGLGGCQEVVTKLLAIGYRFDNVEKIKELYRL